MSHSPAVSPASGPRTANQIISDAIKENRYWEVLSFCLVAALGLTGIGVLISGAYAENGAVALSGTIAAFLVRFPLKQAREIRNQNVALRILELSVINAKTEKQAAEAIIRTFLSQFGRGVGDVVPSA